MTELQSPQRKSYTAKAIFGLLLAIVMVAAFATAGSATPRSGELHVTKECPHYYGNAGEFCTIVGSNINAIRPGMNVIYTNAADFSTLPPTLDTDLVLDGPGNNDAYGHVVADLSTGTGEIIFSGGTGRFRGFHATVALTHGLDWDGTYSFTP